jgi:hypothetical protein
MHISFLLYCEKEWTLANQSTILFCDTCPAGYSGEQGLGDPVAEWCDGWRDSAILGREIGNAAKGQWA